MRYHQLLVEYKRETTKKQFEKLMNTRLQADLDVNRNGPTDFYVFIAKSFKSGNTIPTSVIEKGDTEIDNYLKDRFCDILLSAIEKIDFTPNKKYVPWVYREYAAGNIVRLEDVGSIIVNYLKKYDKFKNKADFIKKYPKLKNIFDVSAQVLMDVIDEYSPKEIVIDKGKSELAYEDNVVRVIAPLDKAAACYYGQGTRWCTAATEADNPTQSYLDEGRLYILLPKSPKRTGEKYQLHIAAQQFMNEKDDPVPLSFLVERFPGFVEYLKTEEAMQNEFEENQAIYLAAFLDDEMCEKLHKAISGLALQYANKFVLEKGAVFKKLAKDGNQDLDADALKRIYLTGFRNLHQSTGFIKSHLLIDNEWIDCDFLPKLYASQIRRAIEIPIGFSTYRQLEGKDMVSSILEDRVFVYPAGLTVNNNKTHKIVAVIDYLQVLIYKKFAFYEPPDPAFLN